VRKYWKIQFKTLRERVEPKKITRNANRRSGGRKKKCFLSGTSSKGLTNFSTVLFQDLDSSEDEDFLTTRKNFQDQRHISTDSKKSIRFYEMENLSHKDENIRQVVPFVRQITEDGKAKLEVYRPTTNPIYIYTQVSIYHINKCDAKFRYVSGHYLSRSAIWRFLGQLGEIKFKPPASIR
jgi:hypothetical protein